MISNSGYSETVSIEELKQAYRTAARIVAIYGDKYLLGFQRLHEELEKQSRMSDFKSIALKVAASNNST